MLAQPERVQRQRARSDPDLQEVGIRPAPFPQPALIADNVEEHTSVRASQAPLVFQGGNCLIGDDFWLLGTQRRSQACPDPAGSH